MRGPASRRDSSARRSRLRNLNWELIPKERVEGRRSVWSGATTGDNDFTIDLRSLVELFGQKEAQPAEKVASLRRSLIRCGSPKDAASDKVSLLDAKRSMNVGIFLRQFKSAASEIVEDVKQGAGERYGAEKLSELCKLLPDSEEEKRLRSFQGERSRLGEPDLFMVLLVEIPSFRLRLDAMILQQEFDPAVTSLCVAARCLGEAARELLNCQELHSILHLVLRAGNYMNDGGYAGNAAGFRIASLLKLADTKANKPGMNLLHFVAMEAVKKNPGLLSFPSQLGHVGPASRQSEESVQEDLSRLRVRVEALCASVQTEPEIQQQMQGFMESAEVKLGEVEAEVEALQKASQALVEFFCEDESTFKLEEACRIFFSFCHRFQKAVQENAERELAMQRRAERQRENAEKRRSVASCTGLELGHGQDDLERTLEKSLSYTWHRRSQRHSEGRRTSTQFGSSGVLNTDALRSQLGLSTETACIKNRLNVDDVDGKQGLNVDVEHRERGLNAGTAHSKEGMNVETAQTHSQCVLTSNALPTIPNLPSATVPSQHDPSSDAIRQLHGPSIEGLRNSTTQEKMEQVDEALPFSPDLPSDTAHKAWGPASNPSDSTPAMVTDEADPTAEEPSAESARLLRLVSKRVLREQGTLGAEVDMRPEPMAPEPVPLLAQDAEPLSMGGSERMYPRMGETLECHTLVRGLRSYENMTTTTPLPRAMPSHCSKWRKEREADEREGARDPQGKEDARGVKDPPRGVRRGLAAPKAGMPSNPAIPRVRAKAEPSTTSEEAAASSRPSRLAPPRSASVRSPLCPRPASTQPELKRASSAREKPRAVAEQPAKPGRCLPERPKPEKDKAPAAQSAFIRGSPLRVTKRLAPNPESHIPSPPRTVQNPASTTAKTIRKAVITAAVVKTAKNCESGKPKTQGTRLPGPKVSRPATQPASQPMWR